MTSKKLKGIALAGHTMMTSGNIIAPGHTPKFIMDEVSEVTEDMVIKMKERIPLFGHTLMTSGNIIAPGHKPKWLIDEPLKQLPTHERKIM